MSETDRVDKAWDRIEAWFKKNIPEAKLPKKAAEAKIEVLEKKTNQKLPEGLRASLLRHDGMEEGHWPKGQLLGVQGIDQEWSGWTGLLDKGTFDKDFKSEETEELQKGWWNREWIPIDRDGAGNGSCIDLNPGSKGKEGQVIDMDHESGPNGPHFDDFASYLEDIASQLEAGKYKNEDGYLEEAEGYEGDEGDGDDGDDDGEGEGEAEGDDDDDE